MGRKKAKYELKSNTQVVKVLPNCSMEGYQLEFVVSITTEDRYGYFGSIEFEVESEERIIAVYNRLSFLDGLFDDEIDSELGNDELDTYYWSQWTHDGDLEGVILNQFNIYWADKDGVIYDVEIESLKEPERAKETTDELIASFAISASLA